MFNLSLNCTLCLVRTSVIALLFMQGLGGPPLFEGRTPDPCINYSGINYSRCMLILAAMQALFLTVKIFCYVFKRSLLYFLLSINILHRCGLLRESLGVV